MFSSFFFMYLWKYLLKTKDLKPLKIHSNMSPPAAVTGPAAWPSVILHVRDPSAIHAGIQIDGISSSSSGAIPPDAQQLTIACKQNIYNGLYRWILLS